MVKLIIANWKLNPKTVDEAIQLAKASDFAGAVIVPPFIFLEAVSKTIKKAKLGAQDVFWEDTGAFTGEVSPSQLKNLGVKYVIIGHSERRSLGETDEMVGKKVAAAFRNGLIPILCIGETAEQRQKGETQKVVERQLKIGLSLYLKPHTLNLIIAYEPIWAIGTGNPDTPEDMIEMAALIKSKIKNQKSKIIYGGSITSGNAAEFLGHKEIEGALVGGASLKSEEFKKIIEIAKRF